MAVNSKKKGNKAERDLCKWWKDWSGLEFSRVPASGGLRWKKKDDISGDVICTDDRHSRRFPFSIESKAHKDIKFEHLILDTKNKKILEFWEQAKTDAERSNKLPILFMRYNRMPKYQWVVCLREQEIKTLKKTPNLTLLRSLMGVRLPSGENIYLINSSDLATADYKHFIIQTKKLKRNANK